MSSTAAAARNQLQLRGLRPPPLTVNKASTKILKKSTAARPDRRSPVIIYLRSPKIIHVRPEEFKSFVQRLTGNRTSSVAVVASFTGEKFVSACLPS